jgi:hypothetical protein
MDKWLAHVKTVRNFVFRKMCGICCLAEEPLFFGEDSLPWSWFVNLKLRTLRFLSRGL